MSSVKHLHPNQSKVQQRRERERDRTDFGDEWFPVNFASVAALDFPARERIPLPAVSGPDKSLLIGLICDHKPSPVDLAIKLLAQMAQLKPQGFTFAGEIPRTWLVSKGLFYHWQRRLTFDYSLITNHNSLLTNAGVVQW